MGNPSAVKHLQTNNRQVIAKIPLEGAENWLITTSK